MDQNYLMDRIEWKSRKFHEELSSNASILDSCFFSCISNLGLNGQETAAFYIFKPDKGYIMIKISI